MYEEADYRPLSALQHLIFCERQCALIHLEQQWEENRWTAEGRVLHERADSGRAERRGNLRIARSLALFSRRLGPSGIADVVELHRVDTENTRKTVIKAYQKRKLEEIEHPFLGEKTTIGLLFHLQATLLARHLRGDLDAYPPFTFR